jgi:kinesin family protein 11
MEGLGEIRGAWENDPNAGIIPRALSDLFDGLRVADAVEYSVRVSFLELYNEEIFDLLSGADDQSKLRLYEDGQKKGSVIIQGLEEVQVNDKQEVFRILERGSIKRQTAETKMNATSSRSHTIFAVTVFINQQSLEGEDMLKIGKLNLVDLAGSENIGRSGAVNQRAREAGNINQSLLTLGRVITSLVDRTPHIPYRESKLTRLLQDSLGGRTKTSIIATISPASINHEETLSTLDYAHRAKNITNKPEVNQKISKKEKLLEYHHEIDKLKMELLAAREKDGVFLPKDAYEEQIKTKLRQEEEIVYLTKGLKAKEDEMENFLEMFNDTKARLEQTTEERDKTIRALDCTRSVLSKTENDKRQQEYLKQKHKETEKKISLQAKTLLSVSDNSTKDLLRVHDKLERQKVIDVSNENLKCQFSNDFEEHQSSLTNTLRKSVDEQVMKSRKIEAMAVENGEKNNKMMSQLSSHYGQKLSKLIETLGNIRELTSNNEYAEQQWIAELIEKTNSEADLRSKQFQDYLIEKLLNAVNEILVTVVRQNDKITQLSSRISENVTELDQNLELFQEKQHNQIVSQHEGDNKILDELISLNETEKQNIALEIKEVDDHKRKQDDMYQKIMDLLEQTREEEKQYEEKRKRLLQSSMQDLERRDILSKKAQTLQIENANNVNILNDNYKKQQSQLINRMNGERKDTMNEINNLADTITCSAEELKSDSERFISDGKVNCWQNYSSGGGTFLT